MASLLDVILEKTPIPDDIPGEDRERIRVKLAAFVSFALHYETPPDELLNMDIVKGAVDVYRKGEVWCTCGDVGDDDIEPFVSAGRRGAFCNRCGRERI